ncbi:TlpA family protein disulfide reductase [Lentibacillus sediminis]|uniref:TlpA family protein disulfide reductase n=1 Tax=Lentibacillus sediminis TaxID=1940529 RepID=UPI000C1BDE6A|nr:TlpA disulfide reductase family protein [Lentibacillus sediminis]
MQKKVLGVMLLLVLAGIAVSQFIEQNSSDQDNEANNSNSEGGMIAPQETAGLEPGSKAPDFELETWDGETIQLSELEGKKVILNFWATWCGPCREEMPEMQEFYRERGDEVEILAVNLTNTETSLSDVDKYMEEYGYSYPILLDKDGEVSEMYRGSVAVPTTYFIGTDGRIQAPRKTGPMTYAFMEETINSID